MDPEAALKRAEAALVDDDYEEAREALEDYLEWRGKGGFQPRGGDKRAKEIEEAIETRESADARWEARPYERQVGSGLRRDDVIEGFATAIWQTEWASACERAVEDDAIDELPWPGGADIAEYAPETPDKARAIAKQAIAQMERANRPMTLAALYKAARAAKYDAPDNSEMLGFQLGMQWLGTGVGLPHEGAVRKWKVGHGEVNVELNDADPNDAEIDYASTDALSGVR